ncbi:MAG: 16S rRNA (guanine(527)-N(7))-methyltransferase RsmG [Actinomycetota bacterium]
MKHSISSEDLSLIRREFGPSSDEVVSYMEMLKGPGVERGVIGPNESSKLLERHIISSFLLADLMPFKAHLVDVGSGAGLPGIPLAIARKDLEVTLIEPMARRIEWLNYVSESLMLDNVSLVRSKVQELNAFPSKSIVWTSRALAPLTKLLTWMGPIMRKDDILLAVKGIRLQREMRELSPELRFSVSSIRLSHPLLSEPVRVAACQLERASSESL